MRTGLTIAVAVVALATLSASVRADEGVRGTYAVRFDKVVDNCKQTGIGLSRADVKLAGSPRALTVTVPMMPVMRGRVGKAGKLHAKAKKGKTGIAGVTGSFSISGRVKKRSIEVVLIAEYFSGDKPLCTQSWTGTGKRR
ncbi:MAG TPA: hypothetical protein VFG83_09520 [Kofleriaceae bacterium]|nr:hypothetical protein [Kofleriaceae bacterium]